MHKRQHYIKVTQSAVLPIVTDQECLCAGLEEPYIPSSLADTRHFGINTLIWVRESRISPAHVQRTAVLEALVAAVSLVMCVLLHAAAKSYV